MFTPENVKKLTNVSTVTLKKHGRRYEVAVYPNKLYEYKAQITTDLDEILHTRTIYRSVARDEICSQADLMMLGENPLQEILVHGHEKKPKTTRDYEVDRTEAEILGLVGRKGMLGGRYVHGSVLREAIAKVHSVVPGNAKKQSQEVIAKLCSGDFERVSVKVRIISGDLGKISRDEESSDTLSKKAEDTRIEKICKADIRLSDNVDIIKNGSTHTSLPPANVDIRLNDSTDIRLNDSTYYRLNDNTYNGNTHDALNENFTAAIRDRNGANTVHTDTDKNDSSNITDKISNVIGDSHITDKKQDARHQHTTRQDVKFNDLGRWEYGFFYVKSEKFPHFRDLCQAEGVQFVVVKNDEEEDEIIE